MYDILLNASNYYSYLGYALITVFAIFEGPIVTVMLGSIVKLGYLNITPVLIAVMLGDVIGDITLYSLGYKYGDKAIQKVQEKIDIKDYHVEKVKKIFHKNKYLILFTSKITNGVGFSAVVLLTAGIVRIPFVYYMIANIVGQFIWSGVLLFLGYHFVGIYHQIDSATGKATYLIIGIIVIVAIYLFMHRKKPINEVEIEK